MEQEVRKGCLIFLLTIGSIMLMGCEGLPWFIRLLGLVGFIFFGRKIDDGSGKRSAYLDTDGDY